MTVSASFAPGPRHELSGPHRRPHEAAASPLRPTSRPAASCGSNASYGDRAAAFEVQRLLAHHLQRGAPPPERNIMLAAYRAHLAARVRYFGPLTPVDLRV